MHRRRPAAFAAFGAALITIAFVSNAQTVAVAGGQRAQPEADQAPLPTGWPRVFELGFSDSPGGAAALRQTAPFAFRYQYLAGGVNTGTGWSTWNTNGDFARFYIEDSVANGVIPVFSYYMLL